MEKKDIIEILISFLISLFVIVLLLIYPVVKIRNIHKNSILVSEKFYKKYTVLETKAIKYFENDEIHFLVTLIDDNNKQIKRDDYTLFEQVKKHRNQTINIGFERFYYHDQNVNKNYFYQEKILSPLDITYTDSEIDDYEDEIVIIKKEQSNNKEAEHYLYGYLLGRMIRK